MDTKKVIPTALSIAACIGVPLTAVLAAKGHVTATDILKAHEMPENATKKEVIKETVKLTWKTYAPALISGTATMVCILASNGMHLKTEAGLAALAAMLGARISNMDREIIEKYGKEVLDQIRNDISKKSAEDHADDLKDMDKGEDGEGVYYEPFTETFFWAKPEDIQKANDKLNEYISEGAASLKDLIDNLPISKEDKKRIYNYDWIMDYGWYPGDETFDYNASFAKDYDPDHKKFVKIIATPSTVDGWDANILTYDIYPCEPGEDYIEMLKGEKIPYHLIIPEPGDQLDLRNVDWEWGIYPKKSQPIIEE